MTIVPNFTKVIKKGVDKIPAQWTAEIIGEMHLAGVTAKQLAAEVGWHDKYLSAVMNGHREPKKAEEKLRAALAHLTAAKTAENA